VGKISVTTESRSVLINALASANPHLILSAAAGLEKKHPQFAALAEPNGQPKSRDDTQLSATA
jgi:hypothetical protein